MRIRLTVFFMVLGFTFLSSQHSRVNFAHVEHLTQSILLDGDSVNIIHIYADYPSYNWTEATDEGVSCVDDVARVSVAYLRHYELTGNVQSKEQAKKYLKFVMKLQAADGQFYNFLYKDGTINRNGKTSFKSFGWWAARGVWCMGLGYRILHNEDPVFAGLLRSSVERTFPQIDSVLVKYGQKIEKNGLVIPQWMLYNSGSDATTELLLGLTEFYTASKDIRVKGYIEKFSAGMTVMQNGDARTFPYGLHRSWETMWHAWGNSQTQALAQAGKILRDTMMILSAKRESDGWYSRLLMKGFIREFDVADTSNRREFEQIAYDVRPVTIGLIRTYEATGEEKYLTMAKIAGSWFYGNNAAQAVMYDSSTGRGYDGILSAKEFNKNSGAESTIEALNALMELDHYDPSGTYLSIKRIKTGESKQYLYALYSSSSGRFALVLDKSAGSLSVLQNDALKIFLNKQKW